MGHLNGSKRMDKNLLVYFLESWKDKEGNVNSTSDILAWIERLNRETIVDIREISIDESSFWFYDDYNGEILNRKRSFFSVKGLRYFDNDCFLGEQPIIIQPEIGYLGIIVKIIDGRLNFLMQAKIEPGNVNCVQISPTIQATKSNFTRTHGGKLPKYFSYFENAGEYRVIYDQIQSEQSARFLKKRNRNMIMLVDEEIEVLPNFKWMTLGQIKKLMEIDNLVNMDTRTVLSGIPFLNMCLTGAEKKEVRKIIGNDAFYLSLLESNPIDGVVDIFQAINNYKMFHDVTIAEVPLNQLVDWRVDKYGVFCKKDANFEVRYYAIEIEGREVQKWEQPLFKAVGSATFGLVYCIERGKMQFLVSIKPEIGAFDKIEIAPTIQVEAVGDVSENNSVEELFFERVRKKQGIHLDVMLSEEGGRFFHEQNRNLIVEIEKDAFGELPEYYFWVDFSTLNYLVQVNNCLNIQLRNLLSLLDFVEEEKL